MSCSDGAMPRPRPPHVARETTRHGKVVWYVRLDKGRRVRLPCGPGGDGFDEAYRAALEGRAPICRKPLVAVGSLAWLVARYRDGSDWRGLSAATRRQREAILTGILATAGGQPVTRITRAAVASGRDRRADRPAAARHYLDTLKGLFRWALDAGLVTTDPTEGVRPPRKERGPGFEIWSAEDVEKFEMRWPLGTRARVAFDLLRYTGLRRGDAVRVGRPHVRDGVLTVSTEKTGTRVTIRIVPPLVASLAAGPIGDLTFIAAEDGRPMVKESFGNAFRDWCRAADVTKSAHGLRKLAATTMAEAGATVTELESVFGWSGGGMASLYTRAADRAKVGLTASAKLDGTISDHPIPAPDVKVRGTLKKHQ